MEYTYEIIESNMDKIIVRSDGACIPFDERNSDYQAYLAQKAELNGNN